MQSADQREESSRSIEIDIDFSIQPLSKEPTALVVQTAPTDIDRLDLGRWCGADGLVITVADEEVILDYFLEGLQRQCVRLKLQLGFGPDGQHQSIFSDRKVEAVGSIVMTDQLELVGFEDVENSNLALVFNVGVLASDRSLIEVDLEKPSARQW